MTEPSDISTAKHLLSRLTAESLQSRELLRATDGAEVRRLLPKLIVVKVGGLSIIDRGPEVLVPVAEQIAALAPDHQLLICTGEGTRARHAYALATDLGLPTGMLSMLGNSAAEQNARILTALLMDHGALHVPISLVPTLVTVGGMLVISGMPPFEWWEPPPAVGRIPEYRTDSGTFLIAEALGAEKVIYVKDQDGLYESAPAPDSDQTAAPVIRIAASELVGRSEADLPLEPATIDMLARARVVRQVQLVNGLTPGAVAAAVRGEPVGSLITAG